MQEKKKNYARNAIAVGALVTAVGAGYILRDETIGVRAQDNAPAVAPVVQTPATRDAAAMQNAFAEVSKAVEAAV